MSAPHPSGTERPATPLPPRGERTPAQFVRWGWSVSPTLTILSGLSIVALVDSCVGYVVDDRMLAGVPVWNKPAKFAISLGLWAATLVGIYSIVERGRLLRGVLELLGASMILELNLIVLQAGRSVRSHYNFETAFDGAVFRAMAAGVGTMTVVAVIAGAVIARRQLGSSALGLAVKSAVPVMTVGAVSGYVMTSPRDGQIESGTNVFGGHTIGAPDGGPGLPLMGWSTEFGDLRVSHFIGSHALQAIPLIALLLRRAVRSGRLRLTEREQRWVVGWGALAYVGLMVVTFWQALRGQSLVRPDLLTTIGTAVAVGLPAAATLPLLRRGRRRDGSELADDTFAGIEPDDLAG